MLRSLIGRVVMKVVEVMVMVVISSSLVSHCAVAAGTHPNLARTCLLQGNALVSSGFVLGCVN